MTVLRWMEPRDHGAASRAILILCVVAVGVTVAFAPLQPAERSLDSSTALVVAGIVAFILVLSLQARVFHKVNVIAWALCPLLAVAAIVLADLLTDDATVAAQIFLLFPTLYGAWQLRPQGAAVITGASLVGEFVVVGVQLPLRQAIVDAGYVSAALVTTSVLLTLSGERQARLVARLEQQAAVDPLTGLVTRRVLDEAAASALSGAGRQEGTALVLLDVDHFKSINDRFGHPGGDEVLVQLAERLMHRTRRGDVVCRLGGDEVALLLPACASEVATKRAEELLDDIRGNAFSLTPAGEVTLSVSMGLAHAPTHAVDLQTLYSVADAALYRAKQAGRDRLVIADVRTPSPSGADDGDSRQT